MSIIERLNRTLFRVWEYRCDWCGETAETIAERPTEVITKTIDGERWGFKFCSHDCHMAWSDAGNPQDVGRPATFDDLTREELAGREEPKDGGGA